MPPSETTPIQFDFVDFVARRRGLDVEASAALVAEWMVRYEPGIGALPRRSPTSDVALFTHHSNTNQTGSDASYECDEHREAHRREIQRHSVKRVASSMADFSRDCRAAHE